MGSPQHSPKIPRIVAVIDDDFDIRAMLRMALELNGYEVLVAANGREGLTQLRAGALVSLILLDLKMPIMNGWEFREAQRADPALAPIPVVVLSGDVGLAEAAAELGVDAALRKPVELAHLLELVGSYF